MKSTEIKTTLAKKLIFIFLLILGNAFMALFTFSEEPVERGRSKQAWQATREGYVKIRIFGELKSNFDPLSPVTLIGRQSGHIVKDAFLIKELNQKRGPEKFLDPDSRDEYLVDVPKTKAEPLLANEVFRIVPNVLKLKKRANKRRRKSYELVY